jgi:hypothetical protein
MRGKQAEELSAQDSSTSDSSISVRISAVRSQRFLTELVNLRDDPVAEKRFEERFRPMLPVRGWEPGRVALVKGRRGAHEGFEQNAPLQEHRWRLREKLRLVWNQSDARTRRWRIERLKHEALTQLDRRFLAPDAFNLTLPSLTPFERVLEHLGRCADRLRICGNEECPAPYFIARRRSQKYCSDDCSAPSQRELKRRWWDEHGSALRAARGKSRSKKVRNRT